MRVPAFTAEHSLYESTVVYRNSIAPHATVNVVSPQIDMECLLCKGACWYIGAQTAGGAIACSALCTPTTVTPGGIPCWMLCAMWTAAGYVATNACLAACDATACKPPAPKPTPHRGCEIWTFGGWIPESGKPCGGCCYVEHCPGKPDEHLGCVCGCFE
jgi:hypothetical protein